MRQNSRELKSNEGQASRPKMSKDGAHLKKTCKNKETIDAFFYSFICIYVFIYLFRENRLFHLIMMNI